MTTPHPLDPDEVACPRCGAPPGVPCTTPTGNRSRTIHVQRRRATDPAQPGTTSARADTPPKNRRTPPEGKRFTREAASEAGRKAAQNRRRRRAEQEAKIAAATEERLRAEAEAHAARLAEDAVRFARDRALLKRQTLDAARKATTRLLESLDGLQRVDVDEDGKIVTEPRERYDRNGNRRVEETPVVRGWASADTVERLAKVAASTLNSLRLEEGKPTTHTHETAGPAEVLGDAGVEDLLTWAAENLPREP